MSSKIKTITLWFSLNLLLGSIITFFIYNATTLHFIEVFLITQIATHIISSITAISCFFTGQRIRNQTLRKSLLIVLPVALLTTVIALAICFLLYKLLYQFISIEGRIFLNESIYGFIAPSLLISIGITILVTKIEHEKRLKNQALSANNSNLSGESLEETIPKKGKLPHGLSFREKQNHYIVDFSEIHYISSHGRKSVIHTSRREYITATILKELGIKLPDEFFIRIHKSFIVNIQMISHIQYYMGGSYLLFLKDEEKTTLPVGRKHAAELKDRLNIQPKSTE